MDKDYETLKNEIRVAIEKYTAKTNDQICEVDIKMDIDRVNYTEISPIIGWPETDEEEDED